MIKNNKIKTIISSLITLLPALFGIIVYDKLPSQMATHWGTNGDADGFSSAAVTVFVLPIVLLLFHLFALAVTSFDRYNRDQNKKALGIVFWIVPFISVLSNSIIYATAFGMTMGVEKAVPAVLGLMFIFIGNYMPKCRRNFTLGIKIKPTLESESNWNATHRLAGKIWFFGGLVMLFFVLLPTEVMLTASFISVIPMIVIPTVYSYAYRKKEIAEGREMKPLDLSKSHKAAVVIACIAVPIILVLVSVVMFTGDVDVVFNESSLTVDSIYYDSLTVEYSEITDIDYRNDLKFGAKVNGFNSARLLLGQFKNGEFGNYTIYAYRGADECIVISVGEKTLVISGRSNEETKELYNELLSNIISEE